MRSWAYSELSSMYGLDLGGEPWNYLVFNAAFLSQNVQDSMIVDSNFKANDIERLVTALASAVDESVLADIKSIIFGDLVI